MQRKQFLRHVGSLIGGAALAPLVTACGGGDTDTPTSVAATDTSTPAAPTVTGANAASVLSAAEIAGLKFMREEEKLAHDVYIAMYALWNHNTFENIAESETSHTEAILALLTQYSVDDPAAGKPAGLFEDPELQSLYDRLVAAGSANLIEGLKVGALIEETDIQDIEERKAVTDEADILRVYDSLLCGSRNHLRAFDKALRDRGVTYAARILTQQEWDAIAYSTRETCGG